MNTQGKYYANFKDFMGDDYEDNHWGEDSIFLERNSRDFIPRIEKINTNAEAICNILLPHPKGTSLILAVMTYWV